MSSQLAWAKQCILENGYDATACKCAVKSGTDTHMPTDRVAQQQHGPIRLHSVFDVCTLAWLNHIWHHIWHSRARDPTAYRPVSEWQPQLAAQPLRSHLARTGSLSAYVVCVRRTAMAVLRRGALYVAFAMARIAV
jgi:hypothetical protein